MKKAFTLIELLVVVLIIGILAAVAVPQYEKAVIKTRYASLKFLTKSIADAQEIYYLANGEYSNRFDQLDVDAGTPSTSNPSHQRIFPWGHCYMDNEFVLCNQKQIQMRYQIYYQNTSYAPNQTWCVAVENEDLSSAQNQICKAETGQSAPRHTDRDGSTIWQY